MNKHIAGSARGFEEQLTEFQEAKKEYEYAQERLKQEAFGALLHEQLTRTYISSAWGITRPTLNRWMHELEDETGVYLPVHPNVG